MLNSITYEVNQIMRKNIFCGLNGAQVPGYISVNEEAERPRYRDPSDNGAKVPSCIEIPRDNWRTWLRGHRRLSGSPSRPRNQGEEVKPWTCAASPMVVK